MNPDNVEEFVSLLDIKDGILLGNVPYVEDDSEENAETDTNSNPDEKGDMENRWNDEGSSIVIPEEDEGSGVETSVAEAVEEVGVQGLRSASFVECRYIFTSNKTTQICVSSLDGYESWTTESEDDDK